MIKSRKNKIKKNSKRKSIDKKSITRKDITKKCIYTDEAKRIIKIMKELRKKNKTRKNKSS